MTWMKFAGGRGARIRPFAGLYLRTPRRTRFWGWGEPPLPAPSTRSSVPAVAEPAPVHPDRPWAALGDWLRAAHAMFGSEDGAPSFASREAVSAPGAPTFASNQSVNSGQAPGGRKGWETKRRLRFVCNRHVIGFVFD